MNTFSASYISIDFYEVICWWMEKIIEKKSKLMFVSRGSFVIYVAVREILKFSESKMRKVWVIAQDEASNDGNDYDINHEKQF